MEEQFGQNLSSFINKNLMNDTCEINQFNQPKDLSFVVNNNQCNALDNCIEIPVEEQIKNSKKIDDDADDAEDANKLEENKEQIENQLLKDDKIIFLLKKEKILTKKTTKSNQLQALKNDASFTHVIKFEYENNTEILKTKLDEPINNLLKELCGIFHIDDDNQYSFYGKDYLESKINNIKFMRWTSVENLFRNARQTFQAYIKETKKRGSHLFNTRNLNMISDIYSKEELIINLNDNRINNKSIRVIENFNFKLDNETSLIVNHLNDKFSSNKFDFKSLHCLNNSPNIENKHIITKYFDLNKSVRLNISNMQNLREFIIEEKSGKITIPNYTEDLHLVFNNFEVVESNVKLNFNARNLKLTFLDSISIDKFLNFKNNISSNIKNLNLKFCFNQTEILSLNSVFSIIRIFHTYNKNPNLNLSITLNSVVNYTENIKQEEARFPSKFNTNIVSIKIKDNLLSLSKNFRLCIFFAELNRLFIIANMRRIVISDMKICTSLALCHIFTFIRLASKNLNTLKLVDNRIESDPQNVLHFIEINENDGILMKLQNEIVDMNNLRNLEIVNTRILQLTDISKCSAKLITKNLKFDLNSLLNYNYPISKFIKDGTKLKVEANHHLEGNYFNNIKGIPSNFTELTIKDTKFNNQDYALSIFGSILNNSDLNQLKKLKFSRCSFSSPNWLNELLNNFSFSKLNSLYLDNIQIETNLDQFLQNNADELIIKDSFIGIPEENKHHEKREFELNTLRLNFLVFSEIYNENSKLEKSFEYIDDNILVKQINTFIIENETLKLLQKFSQNFKEKYFKNFIINGINLDFPFMDCLFTSKNSIKVENLVILKENSAALDIKMKEKATGYFNNFNFNHLHITFEAINAQIFNQPSIGSLTNYISILYEKKDNELNAQKSNIEKNFFFLDFLTSVHKMGKKVSIYFKTQSELNEFIVLLHIKENEVLRSKLSKAEGFTAVPIDLMNEVKKWFKADKTNLIGINEVINQEHLPREIAILCDAEFIQMDSKNIIKQFTSK